LRVRDRTVLDLARNAVQRFVSQVIGGPTLFAVKIRNQPAAHLDVSRAARVHTFVQPGQ
jgi:hypothetical protein